MMMMMMIRITICGNKQRNAVNVSDNCSWFLFLNITKHDFFLQAVTPCERAQMYKLKNEENKAILILKKKPRYMNTLCEFAVRLKYLMRLHSSYKHVVFMLIKVSLL